MAKKTTKKTRFAFRTTPELKDRIAAIAKDLGLSEAVVGEAALESVVAYVEKYGELTIPIKIERHPRREEVHRAIVAASRLGEEKVARLNEPSGEYQVKKGKTR